jgi:hypothetical protein
MPVDMLTEFRVMMTILGLVRAAVVAVPVMGMPVTIMT